MLKILESQNLGMQLADTGAVSTYTVDSTFQKPLFRIRPTAFNQGSLIDALFCLKSTLSAFLRISTVPAHMYCFYAYGQTRNSPTFMQVLFTKTTDFCVCVAKLHPEFTGYSFLGIQ